MNTGNAIKNVDAGVEGDAAVPEKHIINFLWPNKEYIILRTKTYFSNFKLKFICIFIYMNRHLLYNPEEEFKKFA